MNVQLQKNTRTSPATRLELQAQPATPPMPPTPFPTDNPLYLAARWHNAGKSIAIATVIATWGSSPCAVGSQLIVDNTGAFAGSVSGGCVESAVITAAVAVIDTGIARTIAFGISDEQAWEVGLACGGHIQIYLERLH